MTVYRGTIKGMKPILLRGGSKAKALAGLITLETVDQDGLADALEAGEKIYQAGDILEAVPVEKPVGEGEQQDGGESGGGSDKE